MKTIRIVGLHPGVKDVDSLLAMMRFNPNQFGLEFVWDEQSPDYVFVSNIMYTNKSLCKKFLAYKKNGAISIFFTGECLIPDFNIFDYAVSFDRHLSLDDRIVRLPTYRFFDHTFMKEFQDITIDESFVKTKTGFCNYMYSHQGHPMREKIFYDISKYKRVDSLGRYLNNTGKKSFTRHDVDWREQSIRDRLPYKFSIAAENGLCPGYLDEKFISCLQAHTIPIYWGDPTVKEEFNPNAFICYNDFSTVEQLIERIKEIDENDTLYLKILKEPWQTEAQKQYSTQQCEKYDNFLVNIFSQEKASARRAPSGTYPEMYLYWFKKRYNQPIKHYVMSFLQKGALSIKRHIKGRK